MEVSEGHNRTAGRVSFGERGRPAGREERAVTARTLAEAMAILIVDLVGVLPVEDRTATLERLANRLDDQSRTPGGRATAALLNDVAEALMQLEG